MVKKKTFWKTNLDCVKVWVNFLTTKVDGLKKYRILEAKSLLATVNFIMVLKTFTLARVSFKNEIDFGKMGIANKGATLVQLKIGDTKLAIVNCHLPSGWEVANVNTRAKKADEIMNWIGKDNDAIIWGGDFNLRVFFDYHPSNRYG